MRNYAIEQGKQMYQEYKSKYGGINATEEMKKNTSLLKEYAKLGKEMEKNGKK